jgi:hypothetical protein
VQWEGSEGIRARPSTEGPRRYQRRACGGKEPEISADSHRRKDLECISGERAMGRQRRDQRTAIDGKAENVSAESVQWEGAEDISGRLSAGYVKFQHPMYFSHLGENGRGISARPTTECPRRFYFSLAGGVDISVRPSTKGPRMYQRRACGGKESAHGHGQKVRGGFFFLGKAAKTSAYGHRRKGRESISGERAKESADGHQRVQSTAIDERAEKVSAGSVRWEGAEDINGRSSTERLSREGISGERAVRRRRRYQLTDID